MSTFEPESPDYSLPKTQTEKAFGTDLEGGSRPMYPNLVEGSVAEEAKNTIEKEEPKVGPCSLGLAGENGNYVAGSYSGNTDGVVLNFLENGLNNWSANGEYPGDADDEGIFPQDIQSDDDVDATVTAFNNAIKVVGVEIDKMRAYRFILCNREKQIQNISESVLD